MKRLVALIATACIALLSIPLSGAAATPASSSILLTEPTHRQINGQFVDDQLATSLGVAGRLGNLIFNPPPGRVSWIIDPALIEEVISMSNGYTLTSGAAGTGQLFAKSWLTQLQKVTRVDPVVAMAYGNPNLTWVKRLSPHEINYLLSTSGTRLANLLGTSVKPVTSYRSTRWFGISNSEVAVIKGDINNFAATAAYVDPTTIDSSRLALIKILNSDLTADRREYLIRDFTAAAYTQMHLVHLSSGKFTVTSTHQKLPITLTNGFPNQIKVNLSILPTNLKVEVGDLGVVTIPAKSKVQVMVPITVLTSGSSGLSAEITSNHGDLLGDPVTYPLKLSVISPVATWLTTGAAILLFFAATIQSLRRIRRRQR
jgi:hypothetical protein